MVLRATAAIRRALAPRSHKAAVTAKAVVASASLGGVVISLPATDQRAFETLIALQGALASWDLPTHAARWLLPQMADALSSERALEVHVQADRDRDWVAVSLWCDGSHVLTRETWAL